MLRFTQHGQARVRKASCYAIDKKSDAAKSLRGIAVEAVKSASLLGREYIPFYS
jgi:hypothetical protein